MNYEIRIKDFVTPVILLMVMMRVFMITLDFADSGAGLNYILRQVIYTAAWASIAWFMSEVSMRRSYALNKSKVKRMKNASLCAMIACLLKFAVTVAYLMPFDLPSTLTLAYSILELLVWLMLAIYFYYFWQQKREQEKHVRED